MKIVRLENDAYIEHSNGIARIHAGTKTLVFFLDTGEDCEYSSISVEPGSTFSFSCRDSINLTSCNLTAYPGFTGNYSEIVGFRFLNIGYSNVYIWEWDGCENTSTIAEAEEGENDFSFLPLSS